MNIAFYTLGCKVNQYESNAIGELLTHAGHQIISDGFAADAVIINSCTVTAESDRKTRQAVRRFRRNNPGAIIILIGCMTQAFPETANRLPEADIILGNSDPASLPAVLDNFILSGERIVDIKPHAPKEKFNTPPISNFEERTRAFLKIEDGCNRFCTYCIIPFARGRVRSKSIADIENETKALAEKGFSEIVLTGINLSAYGSDIGCDLYDAVKVVAKTPGICRVRLGSLEPDHMTDQLLINLKNTPGFCDQFHLSLQSGCDKTLKQMNRHYDTAFYADLISRIRKIFDNPAITTDIMVGFTGETDEDFAASLDFLGKIGFAKTHVFAYSRRAGTVAYNLPNPIPESIKETRSKLMIKAAADCEKQFLNSQVGTVCSVLFETEEAGFIEGYSENYTRIRVAGSPDLLGKILPVRITEASNTFCIGELFNK